jgi:hypothetical protein
MEPTSKLPEVWILMSGIPKRHIGDFLAMWSLGTLFGKTIKVDMAFTRESGVLCILVGCLDYTRILAKERIYIADGFYDITFEVENHSDFEMTTVANLEDGPSDNDGNGNNGDQSNSDPKHGRDAMETDTTPSLAPVGEASRSTSSGPDVNKLASDFSSGVKFSPRVKMMMDQSRAKLRALTEALSAADTVAAGSPLLAAVDLPLADSAAAAGVVATSCAQLISEGSSPSSAAVEPSPMQRVNEATLSAAATAAAGSPSLVVVDLPLADFAATAGDAATPCARPIAVGSSPASATS